MTKKDIMFVCTGNTCRSPIAEALAKKYFEEDSVIRSSGIAVAYEDSANDKAIEVMSKRGIDISSHTSSLFRLEDVTSSMIILTMTLRHKLFLAAQYPELTGRIDTLLGYVGDDGDIVDPYGYEMVYYEECANQLEAIIKTIASKK